MAEKITRAALGQAIADTYAKRAEAPALPGKSLIDTLNALLTDEFVAIHEYTGHYAVAKSMGFTKLAAANLERLNDERKHADLLAYRIAFLGGTPAVGASIAKADCGTTVPEQFKLDLAKELGAVEKYNQAIAEAVKAQDNVTRDMLESIVKDEDDHVDEISTAQDQIEMMGLGQFLVTQV